MPDEPLPADKRRWPIDSVKIRRRNIPVEELLDDLRRVAAELGGARTVSKALYEKCGQFSSGPFMSKIGSWNAALKAAGLEPAVFTAIPEEELMQCFAELWHELGRQPTCADMDRGHGRYSKTPYFKRYKTFSNLLAHFAAWAGVEATVVRSRTNFRPAEPQPPIRHTSRKPTSRQQVQVLMRDGATCRLCGARPEDGAMLEVDHIIPWSKGGETVLENLQVLCKHCNRTKHNLTNDPSPQTPSEQKSSGGGA